MFQIWVVPMLFRILSAAAIAVLTLMAPVGAHEGHDHGTPPPAVSAQTAPRAEAQSALFELVAVARNSSLEIYLDRFETNEPVVGATLDFETPAGPASATVDGNVYRLKAPWAEEPGTYDLLVTVASGSDIDFLTASLVIPEAPEPVVVAQSGWLVGSALATEIEEAITIDLTDRLSRNDLAIITVGALGFALGILTMAVFRRKVLVATGTIAILVVLITGSAAIAQEAAATPAVGVRDLAQRLPDGSVFVPKPSQRILAIRTRLAEASEHRRSMAMPGRVIPDPNASGYVQASIAGRLSSPPDGFPRLGSRVEAGDVLAFVTSPIQAIDQSDLRQRRSELDQAILIAEQRVRRSETLVGSGTVSRTALDEARIELEGLRERRIAIEEVQVAPEPLVAPVSGIIAQSTAVAGQMAESNTVIFHIVDPERLWVEALAYGRAGKFSSASAESVNGKALSLTYEGSGFAGNSPATPVHFRIEGETAGLRPGQMLTVLGQTEETQEGIALPRTSVIRSSNGQDIVFVHSGPERFEPKEIRVLPLDGQQVVVAAGLEAGSRVVTEGAELLNQIR